MNIIKKILGNNLLIYILGEVLSKITPFILVPLIAKVYGAEDISIYANFSVLVYISQTILAGWATSYVSVYYFKSLSRFRISVLITCYYSTFLLVVSLITLCFILFINANQFVFIFVCSIVSASAVSLFTLYLAIAQVKKKAKEYVFFTILKSLTILASVSLMLSSSNVYSIEKILLVLTIIHCFYGIILVVPIVKVAKIKVSRFNFRKYLKFMLIFGMPIIPGALLNSFRTAVDRLLIYYFLGTAVVGVYSVAYQYSTVVLVLSASLIRAVTPAIFQALGGDDKAGLRKLFIFYFLFLMVSAIITNFVIFFFGESILGAEFVDLSIFSFLSYAFVFQASTSFISGYYHYHNKTKILMYVNIIGFLLYCLFSLLGVYISTAAFVIGILASTFLSFYINYWLGIRNVYKNIE